MQWHLSCSGVSSKKITDNPVSQTVNSKAILSAIHTHHPLTKQSPFWRQLWQIWFGKVWNKNEHHCSSLSCPRWEDGAALCAIWSMSGCKWIKKIYRSSPPSVHIRHWCNRLKCSKNLHHQRAWTSNLSCPTAHIPSPNISVFTDVDRGLLRQLQKAENVEFKAVQK